MLLEKVKLTQKLRISAYAMPCVTFVVKAEFLVFPGVMQETIKSKENKYIFEILNLLLIFWGTNCLFYFYLTTQRHHLATTHNHKAMCSQH